MGAWIETVRLTNHLPTFVSHPVWVRGLKQNIHLIGEKKPLSHPVWVRGLKLRRLVVIFNLCASHPVWVRGLKLCLARYHLAVGFVAPRVGAWIETASPAPTKQE